MPPAEALPGLDAATLAATAETVSLPLAHRLPARELQGHNENHQRMLGRRRVGRHCRDGVRRRSPTGAGAAGKSQQHKWVNTA